MAVLHSTGPAMWAQSTAPCFYWPMAPTREPLTTTRFLRLCIMLCLVDTKSSVAHLTLTLPLTLNPNLNPNPNPNPYPVFAQVVYRDLKPENILLDSTGHVKLCDLGFAVRCGGSGGGDKEKDQAAFLTDNCGANAILTPTRSLQH